MDRFICRCQTKNVNRFLFDDISRHIRLLSSNFRNYGEKMHPPPDEFPSDVEENRHLERLAKKQRQSLSPVQNPRHSSIILFPGQGSQFVGMGKTLLPYPNVKSIFEAASHILGYDILDICLNGPLEKLSKTEFCQPAVYVTSLAALEKLKEDKPQAITRCVAAAGFSVGEITALVFGGSLSFENGLKLIKVRAKAMQDVSDAVPSGMMTVIYGPDSKLSYACEAAREYCSEKLGMSDVVCQVANFLYTECKVIAGNTEALDFIKANAKEFNLRKVKDVPVSGAFHTPLMDPAVEPVRKALQRMKIQKPNVTILSNKTGKKHREKDIARNLSNQMCVSVKWEQIQHALFSRDVGIDFPDVYEVGPGSQLGMMLRKTNAKAYAYYKSIEV